MYYANRDLRYEQRGRTSVPITKVDVRLDYLKQLSNVSNKLFQRILSAAFSQTKAFSINYQPDDYKTGACLKSQSSTVDVLDLNIRLVNLIFEKEGNHDKEHMLKPVKALDDTIRFHNLVLGF